VYVGTLSTPGSGVSMTRVGYADIAGSLASSGPFSTTVSLSGVSVGDHLWVGVAQNASTLATFRACQQDNFRGGMFQTFTGRPSSTSTVTSSLGGSSARTHDFLVIYS